MCVDILAVFIPALWPLLGFRVHLGSQDPRKRPRFRGLVWEQVQGLELQVWGKGGWALGGLPGLFNLWRGLD